MPNTRIVCSPLGKCLSLAHRQSDHSCFKPIFPVGQFRRWRKRKGIATIRYKKNGRIVTAEIHWYEAHGIGATKWKVKRELK